MAKKTVNFPGALPGPAAVEGEGGKIEMPQTPPLLDMLQGGTKCCPFMGVNVLTLPVIGKQNGAILTPQGNRQEMALVRHFTPCMGAACRLWNEETENCRMGE
jgi:hypothetical protein